MASNVYSTVSFECDAPKCIKEFVGTAGRCEDSVQDDARLVGWVFLIGGGDYCPKHAPQETVEVLKKRIEDTINFLKWIDKTENVSTCNEHIIARLRGIR